MEHNDGVTEMQAQNIRFKYTSNVTEVHRIPCGLNDSVVVVGDPDNAAYEWVVECLGWGVTDHSDDAFGSPEAALRAGLNAYLGGQ